MWLFFKVCWRDTFNYLIINGTCGIFITCYLERWIKRNKWLIALRKMVYIYFRVFSYYLKQNLNNWSDFQKFWPLRSSYYWHEVWSSMMYLHRCVNLKIHAKTRHTNATNLQSASTWAISVTLCTSVNVEQDMLVMGESVVKILIWMVGPIKTWSVLLMLPTIAWR